jgi:predicted S18 family serine protease
MFPPAMQKLRFVLSGLLCIFTLAACSVNPPVQEMSNARQTIQSAYEVKAQRYAPVALKEAERLLQQATSALDAGDYPSAREYAIAAQQQAIKARQQALANTKSE